MSTTTPDILFQDIVYSKLLDEELNWFKKNSERIEKDELGNQFILIYSLIFRFISNNKIEWNTNELTLLDKQYPSFAKTQWNKQSLCRALLMCKLSSNSREIILKKLVESCSILEQQDFYKGLFFLENAKMHTSLVEEGIRTNVTDVFDAIALNNPYVTNFLSEGAWNQLVLKAIFMGRPLYKIYNLYTRNNQKLALILNDFIQERWSAGRSVSPEVWQLMAGFKHTDLKDTLIKATISASELERRAAQTALQETSPNTVENEVIWVEIGKQFNYN